MVENTFQTLPKRVVVANWCLVFQHPPKDCNFARPFMSKKLTGIGKIKYVKNVQKLRLSNSICFNLEIKIILG